MKHYYTFLQVAAFLMATCIPPKIIAQCDCEDGTPATPVSYTVKIDSSTLDKVIISFPRFDPSIGTLSCIVLKDTTSGVSATHVRNLAPQDIRYRFRLTVYTSITGPGFGISEAYDQYYGPDTLRTYGAPGDSITYGPDTMFNSVTHSTVNSYDGRHFVRLSQAASQYVTAGATAKYQYQYLPNQAVAGKRYFRIRQKDAAGQVSYSPIRVVNQDEQGPASVVIYPNPVKRSLSLQFDKVLNSRFTVEVISAGGQLLQQQEVRAHNTSLIQVELTRPVPPGIYYLRSRDLGTHQQYLHKLLVE